MRELDEKEYLTKAHKGTVTGLSGERVKATTAPKSDQSKTPATIEQQTLRAVKEASGLLRQLLNKPDTSIDIAKLTTALKTIGNQELKAILDELKPKNRVIEAEVIEWTPGPNSRIKKLRIKDV